MRFRYYLLITLQIIQLYTAFNAKSFQRYTQPMPGLLE